MNSTADKDRKTITREKLIASATKLFSENWYDAISIAEICRSAELSNGVFYRYFKNKEEIFTAILDEFLEIHAKRFTRLNGDSVEQRLVSFFSLILESNSNDLAYINIFREGEYRFPEYERRLRDIYLSVLKAVYGRDMKISEYLYIVGSIRFLLRRPCFTRDHVTAEFLKDLVYQGIFSVDPPSNFDFLKVDAPSAADSMDDCDTRTKLILAGTKLIAEHSFYKVNIYEITRAAGYAVGTFYIYFSSKEEFFREVVLFFGVQLRKYISIYLSRDLGRMEAELQGMIIFLKYFETHIQNYQIVREAEFIIRPTAREYYNKFESGYLKNLTELRVEDKVIASNFLIGIAHFLGIEFYFSGNIEDPVEVVKELAGPMCSGLKS